MSATLEIRHMNKGMQNPSKFKSKLWLFPLLFVIYFIADAVCDVFYNDNSLHPYIFLVFIAYAILAVLVGIQLLKKNHKNVILLIVSSILVFFSFNIRFGIKLITEQYKVNLHSREFSRCAKNAVPIPGKGAIGVCDRKSYMVGTELGINASQITEAIIYDSSDQIADNHAQRSTIWNRAAYSLNKEVPFGLIGYKTYKLLGHYYYTVFDSSRNSDYQLKDYPQKR